MSLKLFKLFTKSVATILLFGSFSSLNLHGEVKSSSSQDWKKKMHELRGELVQLGPYIYSESEFQKAANRKKIETHLNNMYSIGHKLDENIRKKYAEKDPSFDYILNRLDEDLKLAKESFSEKKYMFSQNIMKSAVNRCFQCHTQNFDKSQWQGSFDTQSSQFLSAAEKADFLVAMRNFSDASKSLKEELLKSSGSKTVNNLELEKVLQKYILVSVRDSQSPKQTLEFLQELKEKRKLPSFLMEKINSYEESLNSWKDFSREDRLKAAKELLVKSSKLSEYMSDSKGFIESLRASSFLHDYLQEKNISKDNLALSYLLLGKAYQNIAEAGYWDMHETYFARCVQILPHSKLAKQCFKLYKDSVIFRNTGSAGTSLSLRQKLSMEKLESLSK